MSEPISQRERKRIKKRLKEQRRRRRAVNMRRALLDILRSAESTGCPEPHVAFVRRCCAELLAANSGIGPHTDQQRAEYRAKCVVGLRRLARTLGRSPTDKDIKAASREVLPSSTAIKKHFGSLQSAQRAAGLYARQQGETLDKAGRRDPATRYNSESKRHMWREGRSA